MKDKKIKKTFRYPAGYYEKVDQPPRYNDNGLRGRHHLTKSARKKTAPTRRDGKAARELFDWRRELNRRCQTRLSRAFISPLSDRPRVYLEWEGLSAMAAIENLHHRFDPI